MPAFLFEVGTEELPASFVAQACRQWQAKIPASLTEANLPHGSVQVYGTPRRLAVLIEGLPDRQPDLDEELKGPPAKAAFAGGTTDGKPTPAAEGFAKRYGVTVADLEIRPTDKGEFVFLRRTVAGRPTADLLTELAPQWISALEGKRFMRWSDGELRFPRPIRWLVALLDDAILPVTLTVRPERGDRPAEILQADRISRGHRVLHPASFELETATAYRETLRNAGVIVDPAQRQQLIEQQVRETALKLGGTAPLPADLLEEVRDLTEFPSVVVGQFDREFLELPPEVSTTVMVTHQRYFPVYGPGAGTESTGADLLPNFIAISNGDPDQAAVIAAGNGRVVRARLSDGQFFYRSDLKQPLEAYLPKLETVTFQDELGSMRQKVDRVVAFADRLCAALDAPEADRAIAHRAALLCKADLVTQMVFEFPELQGSMGEKYARACGEPEAVAIAIAEHYLPKGAGDALPQTFAGRIVGLADRLDTLTGIFSLGTVPTGSSDPFALRRAANAILNILWDGEFALDLEALIDPDNADLWGEKAMGPQLADFMVQRIRTLLEDEQGIDYDLANAVMGDGDTAYARAALRDPLDALTRARFLQTLRNSGELTPLYATINRAAKLATKGDLDPHTLAVAPCVDPKHFEQASEQALYDALVALEPITETARRDRNYQTLVDGLGQIAPTVARFFDGDDSVLVMADDAAVRRNRLNLLGLLRNHARILADFGAIVKGE
ncbi:MAG: glycine--tRNA ligase subunit beta [Cyanophyceae cyanobacterium]